MALEQSREEDADPPEQHVGGDGPDCNLEAAIGLGRGDEDVPVESQDGSFDDRHGTCMQELHHKHDLAVRQQFLWGGKLGDFVAGVGVCPYFVFANTPDCNPDDVVDSNT